MEDKKDSGVSSPQSGAPVEKFEFTAEIRKLLDILVHSLYTHKEVFLRELISNAADALDKARFKLLVENTLRDPAIPLEIHIESDKEAKTLTISDTGIGMTREELIENIGTIAHSGSLSFLKTITQDQDKKPDLSLIGKFGVGFYSVFMVAKKVEILTLSANAASEAHLWTSEGMGEYTIVPATRAQRGTDIKIHFKDDEQSFLEPARIKEIIRRYSDFIAYPIKLKSEQINKLSAIWNRPAGEVKPEEYQEFYTYLTHIQEKPLTHLHFAFDAPLQFRALLFIPASMPWDIRFETPEKWKGLHLYAKRVFIQADCEELLPNYLRFARGIVESDDLPMNISRETLQENQVIAKIRKSLVRKILDHLETMSKEQGDDYLSFWRNFSKLVKQGYRTDYEHRDQLSQLFRFNSSACANEQELISLEVYTKRMPKGQDHVYYISGENRVALEKSPHLEIFKSKGVEVLYLTDPIDDFLFEDFREYQGKKFVAVDQEELALDGIEAREASKDETPAESKAADATAETSDPDLDSLLAFVKETLKDRILEVRFSKRLTGSPCCLVSTKDGPNLGMHKLMKMMDEKYEMPKRSLEINRSNPLIKAMAKIHAAAPSEQVLPACCHQLLDNALLLEGSPLDTRGMVPRMQEIMEKLTVALLNVK